MQGEPGSNTGGDGVSSALYFECRGEPREDNKLISEVAVERASNDQWHYERSLDMWEFKNYRKVDPFH